MIPKTSLRLREHKARYRFRIRIKIIDLLGGKCSKCGFKDFRALQVDHRKGGATKIKRTSGRTAIYGAGLLKDIKKNPKKYQLLCANCNWIKKFKNNEVGEGKSSWSNLWMEMKNLR